jgi:hypothetical protein
VRGGHGDGLKAWRGALPRNKARSVSVNMNVNQLVGIKSPPGSGYGHSALSVNTNQQSHRNNARQAVVASTNGASLPNAAQ